RSPAVGARGVVRRPRPNSARRPLPATGDRQPTFREDAMSSRRPLSSGSALLLALLAACSLGGPARGQKPPPPAKPNPQAPVLNMPTPLGMQRGTSVELTLTGTNLAEPTGLVVRLPGKVTIPTDHKNGLDNAK